MQSSPIALSDDRDSKNVQDVIYRKLLCKLDILVSLLQCHPAILVEPLPVLSLRDTDNVMLLRVVPQPPFLSLNVRIRRLAIVLGNALRGQVHAWLASWRAIANKRD